jgi:hypothetical protein
MNKRVVMIVLFAILASLSLSAGIGTVTVTGFYTMATGTETYYIGAPFESESKFNDVGVKVQGTSFFSPASPFGLSYMASASKTLSSTMNGVAYDATADPWTWAFGGGAAFRISKSSEMYFEVGAGVEYAFRIKTLGGSTVDIRQLSATGHAHINYALLHNIFLSTGVSVSYPLWGENRVPVGGLTALGDYTSTVITIAPSVGLSFTY